MLTPTSSRSFIRAPEQTARPPPLRDLLQDRLIGARADVENAGYRAPSCVVTNTEGLKKLNQLTTSGYSILQQPLAAANVNSLYRFVPLDPPNHSNAD